MIPIADNFLKALAAGLEVWDHYNKTKYAREYREILTEIQKESGKPIYGNLPPDKLRDQGKIDRLGFQINILIEQFVKESANVKAKKG